MPVKGSSITAIQRQLEAMKKEAGSLQTKIADAEAAIQDRTQRLAKMRKDAAAMQASIAPSQAAIKKMKARLVRLTGAGVAPVTKAASAKKTAPVKKAAPAKKTASAKKVASIKRPAAKKASRVKKATPVAPAALKAEGAASVAPAGEVKAQPVKAAAPAKKTARTAGKSQRELVRDLLAESDKPLHLNEIMEGIIKKGANFTSQKPKNALRVLLFQNKKLYKGVGKGYYVLNRSEA